MIPRARPALLLLAAVCVDAAAGQPVSDLAAALRLPGTLQSRVRFDHLGTADGLSHDSVFAILQDRHGFMWFGTQGGLNRYDGYRVTQYRHDPRDPNSIGEDFIQFLFEDSKGGIWSGRTSLSRFDPATEIFTQFVLPGTDTAAPRHHSLYGICEDRSGFIWLALMPGRTLYRIDPGTGKGTGFDIGGDLPEGVGIGVTSIYRDPLGIIWLGTGSGLIRFDPDTRTSTRFSQDHPNPKVQSGSILGIAPDRAGNLWLATSEGAQNFFDRNAGALTRRWAPPDPKRLGANINNGVVAGSDGLLWLATSHTLKVFDPATGVLAILRHNAADRFSLGGDEITSLASDRDGSLWVGTKGGGVNRFSPGSLRFGAWRSDPGDAGSLSDDNVRAIIRDRAGLVWIGTYDGGLDRFDPASGKFAHFGNDPRNPARQKIDRVYSILEDRSGDLWFGTGMGLNRLDRRTGGFTRFKRSATDGISSVPLYSLLEDRRGRLWFDTNWLDRKTGVVTAVPVDGALSMQEDREGNMWFGSMTGPTRLDPTGKLRKFALSHVTGATRPEPLQVNFIHEDAAGILWLATETGLLRFDPKSETSRSYTTREGLPDNVVQCIQPDRAGNLWLSTNNGLSRFNPRDSTFSNYHESDGLQGEAFNRKSCFVDPDGVMYFGGLHGFNIFDPSRIPAAPTETSLVILTEFRIHGSAVPVRPGSVLPKPVWQMTQLNLPPEDNGLSFEFAALKYIDQARTRYRFTLEGLETRWTEADSRSRSARYTGLDPGMYRFRVQASRDGKTWGGQEASIKIWIAPPWWTTTWSLAGFVLTLAGLLFFAYKLRVRSLHERGVQLQSVVYQRTAELLEANKRAEQARSQAEQAKSEAEQANRTKSVFLANMSHELRTPLNAILGFSNLLRQRSASQEQRRDLDIINRSGEHLLTLINDVLDVAKIEAGRTELEIAPCDLKSLVMDVLDMMRVRAAEKLVALTLEESPEVPRYVRADAARLREILINLLGNAINYTEEGSITMRSSAAPAGADGTVRLYFEIEDTGIGIAAQDQERIFKPFEQVAKSSKRKGTGLGLSITRRLVELMGGKIGVESTPGKGSCFRFEIPVERAEEFGGRPTAGRDGIFELESGQPEYRILVVDDEPENCMVLERLLLEAGFQVRVAENGAQGVDGFREWRPQFIWMDLRMPVMDGIEATRRIRELEGGREVKIAAVTASGFVGQRSEVLAAGLDDYVAKPHRPEEIFECMGRHLGVRYRREAAQSPGDPTVGLRPDAIDAVPATLRAELRVAVTALDAERISRAINKVAEHDADLGAVLARCAESYQYTAILDAVEEDTEEPGTIGA